METENIYALRRSATWGEICDAMETSVYHARILKALFLAVGSPGSIWQIASSELLFDQKQVAKILSQLVEGGIVEEFTSSMPE